MKTVRSLSKTVVQLFEEQVAFNSSRIAISDLNTTFTYGELNKKANQLAHCLLEMGIEAGEFVPICLDKSVNLIVSILGILKIGCVYIPINNYFSDLQISEIIKFTQARIIITKKELNSVDEATRSVNLEEVFSFSTSTEEIEPSEIRIKKQRLAYLIYTSGTTGKPKCVEISHINLIHVFNSWKKIYRLNREYIHLQMADFSFDVFTGDWIRALCSGSKLVICPKEYLKQPDKLYQLILKEKINFSEFVPSTLKKLSDYVIENSYDLKNFKILICGSDIWTLAEYYRVRSLCSSKCRVINSYGVTETTIDSTYFECKTNCYPWLSPCDSIPIGKPFPHAKIYLLNERLEKVNDGEIGEIYIAGRGVSNGYFSDVKLTKEKFLRNLSHDKRDMRFYRTGDYGYLLPDGNIVFSGRSKDFLKIDGIRIDLLLIESVLRGHKNIRDAIIIPNYSDKHGKYSLQCYLVFLKESTSYRVLSEYLFSQIPYYSISLKFYETKQLALTFNGKVDRQIDSQLIIREIRPDLVFPRNETEFILANIWRELLKIKSISIYDDFFDLGGDSFLFSDMLIVVEKCFLDVVFSVQKHRTIYELAKYINSYAGKRLPCEGTI